MMKDCFSPETVNKARMSPLNTIIQHSTWNSSQYKKAKKKERNKKHRYPKGRNKTIPICNWQSCVHRKFQGIYQKLLELSSEFNKVSENKINIQKSIALTS